MLSSRREVARQVAALGGRPRLLARRRQGARRAGAEISGAGPACTNDAAGNPPDQGRSRTT